MATQSLNILCFGDSLTEGYSMYGMMFTPYSETLEERLNSLLNDTEEEVDKEPEEKPSGNGDSYQEKNEKKEQEWDIVIDTDGVSGELVTKGFERRMQRTCK